jgi:hypothetical protein
MIVGKHTGTHDPFWDFRVLQQQILGRLFSPRISSEQCEAQITGAISIALGFLLLIVFFTDPNTVRTIFYRAPFPEHSQLPTDMATCNPPNDTADQALWSKIAGSVPNIRT